jgi:nitrate/nitrite-specific signal transduction histidine kinase
LGMHERANQRHARLNIESRPGAGTKVSVKTTALLAGKGGPKESAL